jgi:type IV pilus assembly protein PilE
MRKVKQDGFTIIEVMVTVVIVSVLSAIAYPAYTQYIVRAKRSAAEGFLFTVANKQEQALLNARTYFSVATGTATEWSAVSVTVPKEVFDNYTITVAASASPAYTVTAAPIGSQAVNDAKCGNLTLTNVGAKGITGTSSVSECWK